MRYLALAALLALLGCKTPHADSGSEVKILGGTLTSQSSAYARSTVAVIVVNADGTNGICTGTLVHRRLVLTAAHCFSQSAAEQQHVVLFNVSANAAVEGQAFKSEKWWKNKLFNPNMIPPAQPFMFYDIAMLLMPDDMVIPDGYGIANLPLGQTAVAGVPLVLAGYGRSNAQDNNSVGVLYHLPVGLVGQYPQARELRVSSGAAGVTACTGDSGGPTYVHKDGVLTVVGITSRATLPCGASPTILTDVRAYMDWIKLFEEDVGEPMSVWSGGNGGGGGVVDDDNDNGGGNGGGGTPVAFKLGVNIALVAVPGDPTPWVQVTAVDAGGNAQAYGMKQGDLIRRINNNIINSVNDFDQYLAQAVASGSVRVAWRRRVGAQWVDGETAAIPAN